MSTAYHRLVIIVNNFSMLILQQKFKIHLKSNLPISVHNIHGCNTMFQFAIRNTKWKQWPMTKATHYRLFIHNNNAWRSLIPPTPSPLDNFSTFLAWHGVKGYSEHPGANGYSRTSWFPRLFQNVMMYNVFPARYDVHNYLQPEFQQNWTN